MSQVFGNRIIWPGTEVVHWELRKGYTLPNYSSPEFERVIKNIEGQTTKLVTPKQLEENKSPNLYREFFDATYYFGVLNLFGARLGFYEYSMPAHSYRRTSVNFNMQTVEDLRIRAFVDRKQPDTIFINQGTVLSIEDVCHTLLTIWQEPLGMKFDVLDPKYLPLRMQASDQMECFVQYGKKHAFDSGNIADLFSDYPSSIIDSFFCVSAEHDRQNFADNLSTMSLLWVIAHEDAHRYSGHIKHFENLGIVEQNTIFDELIATYQNPSIVKARRAAEMEADTCATMRSVDYCFDNEFLAIITDWVSFEVRQQLYENRRRSAELTAYQRLILLRLISLSCVIPLIIFECALQANITNNADNYPSVLIRLLNIIFTVASRAMDVSINQPQQMVGTLDPREFHPFFDAALTDAATAYSIVANCVHQGTNQTKDVSSQLRSLSTPLLIAFFASHGQAHTLGLLGKLTRQDFKNEHEIVMDLVVERRHMYEATIETFYQSKRLENTSRLAKVSEDISFAQNRLRVAQQAFTFV